MIRTALAAAALCLLASIAHAQAIDPTTSPPPTPVSPVIVQQPVALGFGNPFDLHGPLVIDPTADLEEIAVNDAEVNGLEVEGSYHLTPRLVVGASATYGTDAIAPKWRFRGAVDWAVTPRIGLGVSWEHVTDRSGVDDDGDHVTTPGYDLVLAKATYNITRHISAQLVVNNLLDTHYADDLVKPGQVGSQRRGYRAALRFDY